MAGENVGCLLAACSCISAYSQRSAAQSGRGECCTTGSTTGHQEKGCLDQWGSFARTKDASSRNETRLAAVWSGRTYRTQACDAQRCDSCRSSDGRRHMVSGGGRTSKSSSPVHSIRQSKAHGICRNSRDRLTGRAADPRLKRGFQAKGPPPRPSGGRRLLVHCRPKRNLAEARFQAL